MPKLPPLTGTINFNAQHSPTGAFMSFTCGHFGTRGGIGVQIGKPASQDIFIGVKQGDRYSDATLMCLPFYEGATSGAKVGLGDAAQAYLVEQGAAKPITGVPIAAIGEKDIKRYYGWATDRWASASHGIEFVIYTPFGEVPDPANAGVDEMRAALLPAVYAEFTVDNTKGKAKKTGFFGLGYQDAGVYPLDRSAGEILGAIGFAMRGQHGFMGCLVDTTPTSNGDESDLVVFGKQPDDARPFPCMRWSPHEALRDADNPVHRLGNTPGIGFEVPAGNKYTLRLALGAYLGGVVTSGLEMRYLYTRYFTGIVDVLEETLSLADVFVRAAAGIEDDTLAASGLSPSQQFLIAHATRSYFGSTQMLEYAGLPYWNVNEGEYCMMNTLDLSVDQVFWELRQNPWVVRNLLDNTLRFYSYHDEVKDPKTGKPHPGGISFAHDQGIHNNMSPLGRSTYELTNLHGCFSHMTQEQLCNWLLIAGDYTARTGDAEWVRHNAPTLAACYASMLARDNPDPRKRNGVMGFDSSRCGSHGQEITTYDSIDSSLGQARNNLYLAVKSWAAYLSLTMMFETIADAASARAALASAKLAASTIAKQMRLDGFLPAVFERENKGYDARILPAIECVVHPLYWSRQADNKKVAASAKRWISDQGPFAKLLAALEKHTLTLLLDGERRCHFPDGGLRISSTSDNSWQSKLAIVQHVARGVFALHKDKRVKRVFDEADAAQAKWQTAPGSAYWAMSDQLLKGVALGSKYYPRGIATALWLDE